MHIEKTEHGYRIHHAAGGFTELWCNHSGAESAACAAIDYLIDHAKHKMVEVWPVMPPSKGQSPVLFEDGYAEGWAKCLEACRAALAAAPTTQAAPDPRTPADMRVNGGALILALNVLRRAGKNEVADELEKTAAPSAQGDASPTMPKDIEMMATNRYRPVPSGVLAYKVVGGDGNRSLFSGTKDECQIVARKLTEAFLDGAHFALSTHPAAQSAQGDALDTERLDWLTFNISGKALRDIGVIWSEHSDARRAIDTARAAKEGDKP